MRFNISKRLGLGFGAMVTILSVLAFSSWRQADGTQNAVDVLNRRTQQMQCAAVLEQTGHRLGARVSDFLLNPSNPDVLKGVFEFKDNFTQQLQKLKDLSDDEKTESAIAEIEPAFNAIWGDFDQVKTLTAKSETLSHQTLPEAIKAVCDSLGALVTEANAANNIAARAGARQCKVTSLEAYLKVQTCITSLSKADHEEATKFIGAARNDLANAIKNAEFGVFAEKFAPIAKRFDEFAGAFEEIVAGQQTIASVLKEKFHPKRRAVIASVGELSKYLADDTDATGKAVGATAKFAEQFSIWMGVAAAVIGVVLGVVIARSITRPVSSLIKRVVAIQEAKDLTQRVAMKSKDEIGEMGAAFDNLVETLHGIISEVKSGASQIDAGSGQISTASQSLAQGSSEQASSLQQISASLEQMSGQTQQSADHARQASSLAQESKKSADRGQQEVMQMSKAVNEIKQSSAEISKIIKVIDEIAFQTNLLALNAAVEAARAGEAGKGFAVVAEEVRSLAQRSAEAAKNTSAMIEESVKRSDNGVKIAVRVGEALEEITAGTNKVNTLLAEIASASSEQATGIGQINQGVGQLDQVTQQNAGNSEELASSAEEMSAQVTSLNQLVAQFKVEGSTEHKARKPVNHSTAAGKPVAARQPVKGFKPKAAAVQKASEAGSSAAVNDDALATF